MSSLYIIVPLIVILVLMLAVVPMLIKLRPNRISYPNTSEDGLIELTSKSLKCFKSVKLIKNEEKRSTIIFTGNDDIKKCDINLIYYSNKTTKIKHLRLNFRNGNEITYQIDEKVSHINVFVNQVNDEIYKEHVIEHVAPKQIKLFAILETVLLTLLVGTTLAFFISISPFPDRGTFEIPSLVCIAIAIVVVGFFAIYGITNHLLEKYNNGGY